MIEPRPTVFKKGLRNHAVTVATIESEVLESTMAKHRKARAVGFNHVVLEVGDIEEALAFYGRLFDFELRGRSGDMAFIDLGDQFLALQKGRNQPADQGRHFGLVVDDKEAVEGVGRRGDPTVARTVSRLSRPLGQPHRDCKLRQRSIHQSVERAARHGIDPSVKERASDQRTHCQGHGA